MVLFIFSPPNVCCLNFTVCELHGLIITLQTVNVKICLLYTSGADITGARLETLMKLAAGLDAVITIDPEGVTIRPVSYTHLDVYKRQEQGYRLDFSETRFHHEIYLSDPRRAAPGLSLIHI